MKKILAILCLGLMGLGLMHARKASDSYVRDRVVMLRSEHGACSGVEVRADSGKDYVLTAGHCIVLVNDGKVRAILENGNEVILKFIKEDPNSDLLLFSGIPGVRGIEIAGRLGRHAHLHAITHGDAADDYRTDGEAIEEREAIFGLFPIQSEEDMMKCSKPKQSIQFLMGVIPVCTLRTPDLITTVPVLPGSSGGAVLDDSGRLVGIVSGMDDKFSFMVRLSDIQHFMARR